MAQLSQEVAARDAAFRSQIAGILVGGVTSIATTVVHGEAQLNAAKHGIVLADPNSVAAGAGPVFGSEGACFDYGKSCAGADSGGWKAKCSSNPNSQAPCYCAAAATYECFLSHGCYAEAGAKGPNGQRTTTTLASLQQGVSSNSASAQSLGTQCGGASCSAPGGACSTGIDCCSHACDARGATGVCQ